MAVGSKTKRATPEKGNSVSGLKIGTKSLAKYLPFIKRTIALNNISSLLSMVFYVIWILVGIFFLWFIVANFKAGAFDQLMGKAASATAGEEAAAPTETTVPGVGKVNVSCVQGNLSEEAIVKMVQEKSTKGLTDEEKQKLEPCIVEKDTSTPSPEDSPSPQG